MTIMAPDIVGETLDPRDPLLRLRHFFDENSVELLHERDRSGVLAGSGTVNGVRTIAFCTDGTVMGGAMGVEGCRHIVDAYDLAIEEHSPIVGIWHSGGARLAEGVRALHAVGLVFEAMIRASGHVPQISVVVGFAAGGGIPALPFNLALLKGAAIIGVFWGEFVRREPKAFGADLAQLLRWYGEGRVKPAIDLQLPMRELPAAYARMASRQVCGKVVLVND